MIREENPRTLDGSMRVRVEDSATHFRRPQSSVRHRQGNQ